jgi:Carbohydrate esterase, sialic acid-specific acetylesterase
MSRNMFRTLFETLSFARLFCLASIMFGASILSDSLHASGGSNRRTTEDSLISIHSPREYQVFQRKTLAIGKVTLSGRVDGAADWVRAKLEGKPLKSKLSGDWQKIPFDAKARSFFLQTELPAGGWYKLTVEALQGDKVVGQSSVEHFGIGEVFVGAGQSNSTNSGEFPIQQSSGMVSSFSGSAWKIADDPQLGVADNSQGGSYYPAFGDILYEKYKVPIGIAATGYGGTSVNQWQPDQDLFKWMMTRVHQLGPGGFRAILWHQGESDVAMTVDEYHGKLKTIIEASKKAAGWEFPWFVAQVSYHNPDNPKHDSTRTAQAKLWEEGVAMEGPDTDMLVGDDRDFEGKGIHFSPKGLKAHGKMWAEKVSPYLDAILKE